MFDKISWEPVWIEFLTKHYPDMGAEWCYKELRRLYPDAFKGTIQAIKSRAAALGLKASEKRKAENKRKAGEAARRSTELNQLRKKANSGFFNDLTRSEQDRICQHNKTKFN